MKKENKKEQKTISDNILKIFSTGAHQIKSPLNSIYTLLDIILYSYKDKLPNQVQNLILSAIKKAGDLKNLTDDLFQLGKIKDKIIEQQSINLDVLISKIKTKLDEIANQRKVTLQLDTPETLPVIESDGTLLYNIIYNLVENGISYTPTGGIVTLIIDVKQETIKFIIKDTGIGIPSDSLPKIFDEFYRAPNAKIEKKSGTGLGLAIVKKAVELLNGTIYVDSKAGKGTTFTVEIPITKSKSVKEKKPNKRIVIIGGKASGPKTAAKLRRMDSEAEIILVEKEEFLSYSGCGLPYYISGYVKDKKELMSSPAGELRNPDFFKRIGNITVYNHTEVIDIDRKNKFVTLKSLEKKNISRLSYDYLVIATGGRPYIPKIKGIKLKNIFTLHNVTDADRLKEILAPPKAKDGIIIGAGLIGMEMSESLIARGTRVSIIEKEKNILKFFDDDIALLIKNRIELKGIKFYTDEIVKEFRGKEKVEFVVTDKRILPVDFVIIATGIKPEVQLAKKAGLAIGETGAIKVNQSLQTSDPYIYAVGDCAENRNLVTGNESFMPLGSTANKHGRVAAINIGGGKAKFKGIVNTVVFKIFDISAGKTGLTTEKAIKAGYKPISVLVPTLDREHYYKEAQKIIIKLIGDKKSEKLLGAQIFGSGDVIRRIDVVATALANKMKIDSLRELDLAYFPAFGLPFDPINIAANVWENLKYGDYNKVEAIDLYKLIKNKKDILIIDVRRPEEFERIFTTILFKYTCWGYSGTFGLFT